MSKISTILTDKDKVKLIIEKLNISYPGAASGLVFDNPYQLFVATVLSAQTTDGQVNRITEKLFAVIPTVQHLAAMDPEDLKPYIKNCGLYHNKSKHLIAAAKIIVENYQGAIPDSIEELLKLPGVGRKTANVIVSNAYGIPALAVDTHVFRVSNRLGLANSRNLEIVEEQLKTLIPSSKWIDVHHQLIAHGRNLCTARNPKCRHCFLSDLCAFAAERRLSDDL